MNFSSFIHHKLQTWKFIMQNAKGTEEQGTLPNITTQFYLYPNP